MCKQGANGGGESAQPMTVLHNLLRACSKSDSDLKEGEPLIAFCSAHTAVMAGQICLFKGATLSCGLLALSKTWPRTQILCAEFCFTHSAYVHRDASHFRGGK